MKLLLISNLIIINLINLHVTQLINLPVDQKFAERIFSNYQCRMNLMFRTSLGFMVESYYNESGEACKIYCRVKPIMTSGKETANTFMFNAPSYTSCGQFKFCINGQCTPLSSNSRSGAAIASGNENGNGNGNGKGSGGQEESETIVIPTQPSPINPTVKCNPANRNRIFTQSNMIMFIG